MTQIWKEKFPNSEATEQRLMDQRRFILRTKIFSELELKEIETIAKNKSNTIQQNQLVIRSDNNNNVETTHAKIAENDETDANERSENTFDTLTATQIELKEKILIDMTLGTERQRLPILKTTTRTELNRIMKDVNAAIKHIETMSLKETNQLIYSTAKVVTLELGYKITKTTFNHGTAKWKIRLEKKIEKMRADISNLKNFKEKRLKNNKIKKFLVKKYNLEHKTITETIEELKQRVTAVSKKIIRYEDRICQFKQNQQFRTNQHLFYNNLMNPNHHKTVHPNKMDTLQFWKNLWDDPIEHNRNATWIKDIEKSIKVEKMPDVLITADIIKQQIKKVKNWSAPGVDEVHGFWLKHLISLHSRLSDQYNMMLQKRDIEDWMTTGKTFLILKDKNKGAIPSNYRPITCLPTMFKLFTGILTTKIFNFLKEKLLYLVEQKGNAKNSRGTNDQLLIDKMVLKNCRQRKTNLFMAWIDYKKAFDSLPHSWISQCLKFFGICENIENLLDNAMTKWKTNLLLNGENLGTVSIRKGIFQGDSLSPLLFTIAMIPLTKILQASKQGYEFSKQSAKISHLLYMDDLKLYAKSEKELKSLLNTVKIFSDDIRMEFGLDKCAILAMKKGKIDKHEGITFSDGKNIKGLDENYKYLGILEADDILHNQVKKKTSSEYIKRIRKVLKSKLNGGNIIKAINTWAVPVIRYTAGIINWTQTDLNNLDRKTRKQMTMCHALHPRSDVDRLYLPRKIGGRGLLQILQTVEEETRSLNDYIQKSKEKLLIEVRKQRVLNTTGTKKEYKKTTLNTRLQNWTTKALHGQHHRETANKLDASNWLWLQKGTLKKETEGLIFAAQEQALQTKVMKAKIQKISDNSKCRSCK